MKKTMKRMLILAAVAASACGCQTRITATKNAEVANPLYGTLDDNGTNVVRVVGYQVTSGGWYATARSPLWATESLKGLDIGVHTNGAVTVAINDYQRDLSTNAVTLTHNLVVDGAELAAKVGAAIASSGGSVAADSTQSAIATLVSKFISSGGDASKATVTCADGSCTVTDGTITCTDGSCYDTAAATAE